MKIAMIGAGMAGLSCARALTAAGHAVCLFDKGRGPGGRMSTRRVQTPLGEFRFDHGAQRILPRSGAFAAEVAGWVGAGAAAAWTAEVVTLDPGGDLRPEDDRPCHVGVPGMNGIIRHLARDQAVAWGRRVERIDGPAGERLLAFGDGGTEGPFDAVLVAVPAEQAAPLLAGCAPDAAAAARAVRSDPCWTAMLAFDASLEAPFDAAGYSDGPIAWAARNSSKPGRGPGETWVLQASADWSCNHLEDAPEAVAAALVAAFAPPDEPVFAAAHRWRYSQVSEPAGQPAFWDPGSGIGACGDWCCGREIEDAWRSGLALAGKIPAA